MACPAGVQTAREVVCDFATLWITPAVVYPGRGSNVVLVSLSSLAGMFRQVAHVTPVSSNFESGSASGRFGGDTGVGGGTVA